MTKVDAPPAKATAPAPEKVEADTTVAETPAVETKDTEVKAPVSQPKESPKAEKKAEKSDDTDVEVMPVRNFYDRVANMHRQVGTAFITDAERAAHLRELKLVK